MQNKLDELFASGKEFPELMALNEVNELLQRMPPTAFAKKGLFKGWWLLLIAAAGLCSFLFFNRAEEVTISPQPVQESPPSQITMLVQDSPEHPIPVQPSPNKSLPPVISRPKYQSNITDDFINTTPSPVAQQIPLVDPPWEFTADELKSLGILKLGSRLEYSNICDTNFTDSVRNLHLGGAKKDEKKFLYFYLNTRANGGTRSESGAKSDTQLIRTSNLFYPALVEVDMNSSSDVGPQTSLLDWNYISINSASAYTRESKPYLIPIRIVLDTFLNGKVKENHIVFWFKPEPGVLALLPERVAKKYSATASANLKRYLEVRRSYLGWQWTKKNELAFDSETVKFYRSLYRYPSRRQLRKMGFFIGPKYLLWKYNNRYLNDSGEVIELDLMLARNYRFDGSGFRPGFKIRKGDKTFYPVAYSSLDMNSFEYFFYTHEPMSNIEKAYQNELKFKAMLPDLVPICIKVDDEWLVFWFKGMK